MNSDKDLDVGTFKRYGFRTPSEFNLNNVENVDKIVLGIKYITHRPTNFGRQSEKQQQLKNVTPSDAIKTPCANIDHVFTL